MRTVLYLCYGRGPQVEETLYSLISALHRAPPRNDLQYVVYADAPELFRDLDVRVRPIAPGELDAWLGGSDYVHRRKTMTILDALERYGGSVAFVDCDTYYLRSPEVLFTRIAPGRSCLHLREARLLESGTAVDRGVSELVRRAAFTDLEGRPRSISPDAVMWNSGVVGVHADDIGLMREALHLIDQMWAALKSLGIEAEIGHPVHHVEQFATGVALSPNRLSETGDVVFHYWPENLRKPFRTVLPGLLERHAAAPNPSALYARRPRADLPRRLKQTTRAVLRRIGLRAPGMRASA